MEIFRRFRNLFIFFSVKVNDKFVTTKEKFKNTKKKIYIEICVVKINIV